MTSFIIDSKSFVLTSVKNPTVPILIPRIGILYSKYFLADLRSVPSPPKTISKSTLDTNSSCFNAAKELFLYFDVSSIKTSEVCFFKDKISASRLLESIPSPDFSLT